MNLPRTKLFTGSTMGPNEAPMQYVRLKKEGIGMWIKGQVTEAFPPEGEAATKSPWEITLTGVGNPNATTGKYDSYKATVNPGLIAGILPSNWDAEITVGSGLQYMVVDCTSDGKTVTSASISAASSQPAAQTPVKNLAPSSFKILFAVIKDGQAFRTVRDGHIAIAPTVVLTAPAQSPAPGLSAVDRFYVWGLV